MKRSYNYIKVLLLVLGVGFLYAFANARNNNRIVTKPSISFTGVDNLFITHNDVSKLLIQNQSQRAYATKEIIDLNYLESVLNSNGMVRKAEVFMAVDGALSVRVEQKKPIARVHTNVSYYIDEEGGVMPLSTNYSARVPLVTGAVDKTKLQNVYKMAKVIANDVFLKQHIIEIHQTSQEAIVLRLRQYDLEVQLGTLQQLDKKVSNFKAFYQKAIKDKTIHRYSKVNLRFDSQVICTKKETNGKA